MNDERERTSLTLPHWSVDRLEEDEGRRHFRKSFVARGGGVLNDAESVKRDY